MDDMTKYLNDFCASVNRFNDHTDTKLMYRFTARTELLTWRTVPGKIQSNYEIICDQIEEWKQEGHICRNDFETTELSWQDCSWGPRALWNAPQYTFPDDTDAIEFKLRFGEWFTMDQIEVATLNEDILV